MKPLVVIPARSGSKGVPGKNKRLLSGKPLIEYTIQSALSVFDPTEICISTDDQDIKIIAEQMGVKVHFLRPEHLSHDESSTYDVLLHAIDFYENEIDYYADTIVLLQPTSPLRNAVHISGALESYNDTIEMVVSVKETESNPYYVLFEEDENGCLFKSKNGTFSRRQDCPKVWEYNGAIYVINVSALKLKSHLEFERVVKYVMDRKASIDIDSLLDFKLAELIIQENSSNEC